VAKRFSTDVKKCVLSAYQPSFRFLIFFMSENKFESKPRIFEELPGEQSVLKGKSVHLKCAASGM